MGSRWFALLREDSFLGIKKPPVRGLALGASVHSSFLAPTVPLGLKCQWLGIDGEVQEQRRTTQHLRRYAQ